MHIKDTMQFILMQKQGYDNYHILRCLNAAVWSV